jgi:uncharacterized protein
MSNVRISSRRRARATNAVTGAAFAAVLVNFCLAGPAAASDLTDRIRSSATRLNRADMAAPAAAVTGPSMVERAKLLVIGLPVALDNPFRRPDPAAAQQLLERAVTVPGPHRADAVNLLADVLLDRRLNEQDIKRAVSMLEGLARTGDAAAKMKLVELMKDGSLVAFDAARQKLLIEEALVSGEPSAALLAAREAKDEKSRNEYVRQAAFMLRVRSRGSAAARRELARIYLNGSGDIPANRQQAISFYREAIALRDLESGPEIATSLLATGSAADSELARQILLESVAVGSRSGAAMLVRDSMSGGPMKIEPSDAVFLLEKLYAVEDVRGSFLLSLAYRKGFGVSRSEEKAEQIVTTLIEQAKLQPDVLLSFARNVRDGKDGMEDRALAERFFHAAADSGLVEGMFGYAQLVLQRKPNGTEAAGAIGFLERAAARDHVRSIIALGDAHRDGTGVPPSRDNAGLQYQRAIKLTDGPVALERRGNLLLRSGSTARAAQRGVGFLNRAAEKGSAAAMQDLGRAFIEGKVIPRDVARGVDWMERARQAGSDQATFELAQLLEGLPDAASRRARIAALYSEAWTKGVIEAAPGLAKMRLAENDFPAARAVLIAAADRGSGAAAAKLVDVYVQRGLNADATTAFAKAVEATRRDPEQAAELAINLLAVSNQAIRDRALQAAEGLAASGVAVAAAALSRVSATTAENKDIGRAVDFGRMALRAGDPEPLFELAFALLKGYDIAADQTRAAALLEEILVGAPEHIGAKLTLAEALRDGAGTPQNPKRSVALLREAWKAGSRSAALSLGNAYFSGVGVTRDPAAAEAWYRRASSLGVADADLILAKGFSSGEGESVNEEKSASAYRRLANGGSNSAMVATGRNFLSGYGEPRDAATGLTWLETAAGKGDLQAPYDLYHHYLSIGDRTAALKALRRAAELGTPDAQFRLAMLYRDGKEVEQSDEEMMRWLKRAAASGQEYAAKLLQRVDRVKSVKVLKVSLPSDH